MRVSLSVFMLCGVLSFPLLAKEPVAIEHTTIMDAACALQDKRDMQPGCKKNSDAFMKSWHRQAKPLLSEMSRILSDSHAQRIEVVFTVDHLSGVKNISTSKGMKSQAVKKVTALLAAMKFQLINGNEFKLKVRSEKRAS